jgi:integrase
MRQGELFGLLWEHVDLPGGKLRIVQAAAEVAGKVSIRSPKTANSARVVELPPVAVKALKEHRAILMKEGNAGSDLVFPAPRGGLIPRSTFRHRYWLPILKHKNVGAAPRGFHHTRHTYATLALGAGVPVHVVSRVLGHSKASTTLDIYAHVLQAHQTAATEAAQRLFG